MADDIGYKDVPAINSKVYRKVAKANGVDESVVEKIMDFVSESIADIIVADDPKVSVKLDFLGNFFSKPGRREKVNKQREERKNNGLVTDRRRGETNNLSVRT